MHTPTTVVLKRQYPFFNSGRRPLPLDSLDRCLDKDPNGQPFRTDEGEGYEPHFAVFCASDPRSGMANGGM